MEYTERDDIADEDLEDSYEGPPHPFSCWFCNEGNGEEDDDMYFDMEFDTYYHEDCLPEDNDSILEYAKDS